MDGCNSIKHDFHKTPSIYKDIFACLFSIHSIISLSCHEQVYLSGLRSDDGRSISQNVAHLNILVQMINNLD